MITIRAVSNGFIMSYPDLEMEEGSYKNNTVEEVFIAQDDSSGGEFFAMRDLFYSIMEQLGVFNSKHNQYNIRIDVVDKEGKVVYQDWKIRKSD